MIRLIAGSVGALAAMTMAGSLILAPHDHILAAYATSTMGRSVSQTHNAALALRRLNGALILPGQVFSFNKRVGTFNRDSGFKRAPVSYNGQLIDSWGGGVCQASTTTYNAALLSGMEVLERHPHQFCPSYIPVGRDAAVSYGEVDLVLRNPYKFPVHIKAQSRDGELVVQFVGTGRSASVQVSSRVTQVLPAGEKILGDLGGKPKQRNSGKDGYEVAVFRTIDGRREQVSQDSYPAMFRVIQYR